MSTIQKKQLRAGMVGMGMIFDETYRPFFERAHVAGVYDRRFGDIDVPLAAVASRTGSRAEKYRAEAGNAILFESWLRHEVPANRTTAERISVSFNYNWS